MLTLIVACDKRGAIGRDNQLPWRLPNDMAFFKKYTTGKIVAMGRKTAESVGKALPNRTNIVLTSQDEAPFPGQVALSRVADVLKYHVDNHRQEVVICGGASVYNQFLPFAGQLILTRVDTIVEDADTFIPEHLYNPDARLWTLMSKVSHVVNDTHDHAFTITQYSRRRSEID